MSRTILSLVLCAGLSATAVAQQTDQPTTIPTTPNPNSTVAPVAATSPKPFEDAIGGFATGFAATNQMTGPAGGFQTAAPTGNSAMPVQPGQSLVNAAFPPASNFASPTPQANFDRPAGFGSATSASTSSNFSNPNFPAAGQPNFSPNNLGPSVGLPTSVNVSGPSSPAGQTNVNATGVSPQAPMTSTPTDDAAAAQLESTLRELETAHAQTYNTLGGLLDKLPAEAQTTIRQAMETSRQNYEKAKINRERISAFRMARNNMHQRNMANNPSAMLSATGISNSLNAGQPGLSGQGSLGQSQQGQNGLGQVNAVQAAAQGQAAMNQAANAQRGYGPRGLAQPNQGQAAVAASNAGMINGGGQLQQSPPSYDATPNSNYGFPSRMASGPNNPNVNTAQFGTRAADPGMGTPNRNPGVSRPNFTLQPNTTSASPSNNSSGSGRGQR